MQSLKALSHQDGEPGNHNNPTGVSGSNPSTGVITQSSGNRNIIIGPAGGIYTVNAHGNSVFIGDPENNTQAMQEMDEIIDGVKLKPGDFIYLDPTVFLK